MADNQKMWGELGMNLEMHDQLCAVLPGAIGDVFMSQENRPECMDYFDMVLADVHGLRPAELVEFRKSGGDAFESLTVEFDFIGKIFKFRCNIGKLYLGG